jgi:hypothetical protein
MLADGTLLADGTFSFGEEVKNDDDNRSQA